MKDCFEQQIVVVKPCYFVSVQRQDCIEAPFKRSFMSFMVVLSGAVLSSGESAAVMVHSFDSFH